ncbi:MAG: Os1348 family NHLP clan protein [Burkholderiales bacterium]
MSAVGLEAFLARLYTDAALRAAFLADPNRTCAGADLSVEEVASLVAIDSDGLVLAARSIAGKNASYRHAKPRRWWPWRRA